MRICADYHKQGVQVFVYGYDSFSGKGSSELCRQTLAASESVARLHRISPSKLIFVKQNPDVVTQGVFHNDVIATNNKNVLMYHEHAFENKNAFLDNLHTAYGNNGPLHTLEVKNKDISIENAVKSYLFNSQIVSTLNKDMTLVAPIECSENPAIVKYIDDLISADNPITNKCFVDLRQSMKNGGGPACLRLRVVMNRESLAKVAPQCLFSNSTYTMLSKWIDKHYRDRLTIDDMRDPQLLTESRTALDELTQLLELPSVYCFQK
jgi:succinylarginine dihydrolase